VLDDILLLDGFSQSVIYVIAIGHEKAETVTDGENRGQPSTLK